MGPDEVAATTDVLGRVPDAVARWSEGNAALDPFDVEILDAPIRSLSETSPGRFWVGPGDVRRAIERFASPRTYDSIFCVWPTDGTFDLCGWGCSIGPSGEAHGAGFSSIISDTWQGYPDRLHPEEGFVHEWLHQVDSVYRDLGLEDTELPGLHDVADRMSARARSFEPYGRTYPEYEAETGTWQPWYRDLMTGTVGTKDSETEPLGLTPERWALRPGRPGRLTGASGSP